MSLLPQFLDDSPALPGQHPSHRGTSTTPSTSTKPWANRPPAFQDVIRNLMDIESRLAELDRHINHDEVTRAYDCEHATQVADHTAKILAKVCQFDDTRKLEVFRMVARATFCNPGIMVKMTMATNIEEFCRVVPAYLHPSCGLCGAIRQPESTAPVEPRQIEVDPWAASRRRAERVNNAVINGADLGIKFE